MPMEPSLQQVMMMEPFLQQIMMMKSSLQMYFVWPTRLHLLCLHSPAVELEPSATDLDVVG